MFYLSPGVFVDGDLECRSQEINDIENSVFNKLKIYGALDHCFIHDSNAVFYI